MDKRVRSGTASLRALGLLAGLLVLGAVTALGVTWRQSPEPPHFTGATMGTQYSVKLAMPRSEDDRDRLHQGIREVLAEINQQMSTWDPDSEISRFNRHASSDPFAVSPAFAALVADALEVTRRSGGAFDVTVGPLVDAWGFGPPGRPDEVPTPERLTQLRARVGADKLQVRLEPPTLTKSHPELSIDLSAIAKGYAVDRLAELLEGEGIDGYLVEIGGEVRARGTNGAGRPWRLGIEEPRPGTREVWAVLELRKGGLATSGNYRNSYERDGVRYVHTLDPVQGRPVEHRGASVSVLHPRCALADAWATALMVVGPDRALAMARQNGLQAHVIASTPDGLKASMTPGFQAQILTSP
jgi:thiamine biosynthesis lipoprotein